MHLRLLGLLVAASLMATSCGGTDKKEKGKKPTAKKKSTGGTPKSKKKTVMGAKPGKPLIRKEAFGKTPEGKQIDLYTCSNSNGLILQLTNWGATVVRMETPDKNGNLANVALSFPAWKGYEKNAPYFGCTVGRYCNRIAKGSFTLDGKKHTLPKNDGEHHLHGGPKGFHLAIWSAKTIESDDEIGVSFTYESKDGEQGYPGAVEATAKYTLTNKNELKVVFLAKCDKSTHVNLTNHCYWNLAGERSGSILDHEVQVFADKYLAVDATLIPTGKMIQVKGSPFDFTKPVAIGKRIKKTGGDPIGYDHCYALRSQDGKLALAARVKDPKTGRVMEILTTQPGIQFYSGNFLDGSDKVNGFAQYNGFCLETQHYPDTPNQTEFPPTLLKTGETYQQTTVHRFSVEK